MSRFPFPSLPTGWFAVAVSDELKPGTVRSITRFGRELVVFRTAAGRVGVLDAHCPHLGAHLGRGGCVCGEALTCPFHRIGFDPGGRCVRMPYAEQKKLPLALRAGSWLCHEIDGFVMVWHAADGTPPTFELTPLPLDDARWTPLRTTHWTLRTHAQETAEGSVDLAHLEHVHGYPAALPLGSARIDGPRFACAYRLERPAEPGMRGEVFHMQICPELHGLGFSRVRVTLEEYGLHYRLWVLGTPIDEDRIDYRVGLRMEHPADPGAMNAALGWLPRRVSTRVVEEMTWRWFLHDVRLDFPIWENKRYLTAPRLLRGDGPIGRFRRWARQFYVARASAEG